MTRTRTKVILTVVALLTLIFAFDRPRYRGDPPIMLRLLGTMGGFWINPYGPLLFHSWWNGKRHGPIPNPGWHRMHPGPYPQPREITTTGG